MTVSGSARSRLVDRMLIAVLLATAVAPFTGGGAEADAPTQQGWWSATPTSATVDVPPDGLLIQGGSSASAPLAFAALIYSLPPNARAGILTLNVASNSGTVPGSGLKVCHLTQAIKPEQGGPMSEAPGYDCASEVNSSESSGHLTVDVSRLTADNKVAIALLPAAPASRIVLERPGAGSLPVALQADQSSGPPASEIGSTTQDSPGVAPPPQPQDPFGTQPSSVEGPAPSTVAAQVIGPEAPTTFSAPPVTDLRALPPADTKPGGVAQAAASTPSSGHGSGLPSIGIIIALLGIVSASALWTVAGANPQMASQVDVQP